MNIKWKIKSRWNSPQGPAFRVQVQLYTPDLVMTTKFYCMQDGSYGNRTFLQTTYFFEA